VRQSAQFPDQPVDRGDRLRAVERGAVGCLEHHLRLGHLIDVALRRELLVHQVAGLL
jgi:hypothetical protein